MKKKKQESQNKNMSASENIDSEMTVQVQEDASPVKKAKAKHGLKPFTFFSGLIDLVSAVAVFVLGFLLAMNMLESMQGDVKKVLFGLFFWPFIIILFILIAAAGICLLIGGIVTLISSFKSDRRNWNMLLRAIIGLDVLLLIVASIACSATDGTGELASGILIGVSAVSFIFKLIDIGLTENRLKKYEKAKKEEYRATHQTPNFANLNSVNQNNATQTQPEQSEQSQQTNDQNSTDEKREVDFSKLGK